MHFILFLCFFRWEKPLFLVKFVTYFFVQSFNSSFLEVSLISLHVLTQLCELQKLKIYWMDDDSSKHLATKLLGELLFSNTLRSYKKWNYSYLFIIDEKERYIEGQGEWGIWRCKGIDEIHCKLMNIYSFYQFNYRRSANQKWR